MNGTGVFDGSGFKSLSIRWIELTWIIAALDPADRSESRLFRRERPSQAKLRSTIHRRGNFTYPLEPGGRLTTSIR